MKKKEKYPDKIYQLQNASLKHEDVELKDEPVERQRREDSDYEDFLVDKTRYGEFMSTFNHWTGLESNAHRAEYLQNISKKQEQDKEKS